MEITGKIIVALEQRSGTSARTGNAWMMQSFVLETTNEQYTSGSRIHRELRHRCA